MGELRLADGAWTINGVYANLTPAARHCGAIVRKRHFPGTTLGAAEEGRELIADQLAAKAGENRRSSDQARAVLLADAGREPSDQATVWEHDPADRCPGGGERGTGER